MRFGVYLPTFAWADLTFEQAARVKTFARKAEDLGFDALWVAEHFLVAPGLYGTVWMSPLLCLAHAASVTTRIRLATGLLIAPYYHPVPLAREIQTLHHLSNGRFVLGVGPGWDQKEFETLGMKLGERGRRTAEIIAALRRLLSEPDVSSVCAYYSLTRHSDPGARHKGVKPPPPANESSLGHRPSVEYLPDSVVPGTVKEIAERIADLERAGIHDMGPATCGDDLEQLKRFASEIVGRFPAEQKPPRRLPGKLATG